VLLEQLSNLPGVSGQEDKVRDFLRQKLERAGYTPRTDALGNLIVDIPGQGKGPKVMLAAHMDEVGLMVTYIEKSGHLRFMTVGGIDPRVLVSQPVRVGREEIPGVIGAKPIHLQKLEERGKALPVEQLFIDLGVDSKEETEKMVSVGDYACFVTVARAMGEGLIMGKALDDRVGCSVLLELLLSKPGFSFPIAVVFTVQEEVGLRGAAAAAFSIDPEVAVVLEGTSAADVEDTRDDQASTQLGKGPALTLMDKSLIANKKVLRALEKAAQENDIPYQYRQLTTGATDAGRISLSRAGVAAAVVSVPCRYIHAPAALADSKDVENAGKLIKAFLQLIENEGGLPE